MSEGDHEAGLCMIAYKWRLAAKVLGGCSEMYGDCIALSFCEGCHVSHDRRLVWEVGQKDSSFWPKISYLIGKAFITYSVPQVRRVISVERAKQGLICGTVCCLQPVQECWLNWRGLEIVK